MQIFWSNDQLKHTGARFLKEGYLIDSPESPCRAQLIFNQLSEMDFIIDPPADFGLDPILRVHPAQYIDFLRNIHEKWLAEFGDDSVLLPNTMATADQTHVPTSLIGVLGFYVKDLAAEIRSGTWVASYASAQCAVNAAKFVATSGKASYALCRPPGHHAGVKSAMGFCYLNNAAVAAEELLKQYKKVAVIDVDVHHGNGTQEIFYQRSDVFTASMHSDPNCYYPFYTGYEDETGMGEGTDSNANVCFDMAIDDAGFLRAFTRLVAAVEKFQPNAIVIALGVDALRSDPHGRHQISPEGYASVAKLIREWALPTVFVQEGGYASEELGPTVARFLMEYAHG